MWVHFLNEAKYLQLFIAFKSKNFGVSQMQGRRSFK